jgi:hypothetical protein
MGLAPESVPAQNLLRIVERVSANVVIRFWEFRRSSLARPRLQLLVGNAIILEDVFHVIDGPERPSLIVCVVIILHAKQLPNVHQS